MASESSAPLYQLENKIKAAVANRDPNALQLIAQLEDYPGENPEEIRAKVALFTAELHYYTENWEQATIYYLDAIERFNSLGNLERLGVAYNNLGLVYWIQGEFDNALEAYSGSLEVEIKLGNQVGIAQSYQNIALVFKNQQHTARAIEFLIKAARIFESENQLVDLAAANNNLGTLNAKLSEFTLAEEYYQRAIQLYGELDMRREKARVICNIGSLMVRTKDFERGGELFEFALALLKQEGDGVGEANAYAMLGGMFLQKGDYNQAVYILNIANEKSKTLNLQSDRVEILHSLYRAYRGGEQWKQALESYQGYIMVRDSVMARNPDSRQGALGEDIELQIAEREARVNRARMWAHFFYGVALAATVGGIIGLAMAYRQRQAKKQKKRLVVAREQLRRTRFNSTLIAKLISSLKGELNAAEPNAELEHFENLSKVLKLKLENASEELIPLNQEIELLNSLHNFQKATKNSEIEFRLETVNFTDCSKVLVTSNLTLFFLEPFLANGTLIDGDKGHVIKVAFLKGDQFIETIVELNAKGSHYPSRSQFELQHEAMCLVMASRLSGGAKNPSKLKFSGEIYFGELDNEKGERVVQFKFKLPLVTN